jgi:hypothetical protein
MINPTHTPILRIAGVTVGDARLTVDLSDGRMISAPLSWFPRLAAATPEQRCNWEISGGGMGAHWPEIDEDISIEGLLRGAPSPKV